MCHWNSLFLENVAFIIFRVGRSALWCKLLFYPFINQVAYSLIEIKIYLTRETWPAVHSSNIKHNKQYKFNTKYNSNKTFRSLTETVAFSNGVWRQTHYNSFNFTQSKFMFKLTSVLYWTTNLYCQSWIASSTQSGQRNTTYSSMCLRGVGQVFERCSMNLLQRSTPFPVCLWINHA